MQHHNPSEVSEQGQFPPTSQFLHYFSVNRYNFTSSTTHHDTFLFKKVKKKRTWVTFPGQLQTTSFSVYDYHHFNL